MLGSDGLPTSGLETASGHEEHVHVRRQTGGLFDEQYLFFHNIQIVF
jgi:hypothetical protein